MLKGAMLEFFYGWARYVLAVTSAGAGVVAGLQGDFVRVVALFAAAGLFLKIDHKEKEKREGLKVGGAVLLLVFGLSGVALPGA